MMRYIQRDANGKVISHHSQPQTMRDGTPYATEEVADDHPDILAWHAERERQRQEHIAAKEAKLVDQESTAARIRSLEEQVTTLIETVRKLGGE